MINYALVNDIDGLIVNRIVLDHTNDWTPPDGQSVLVEPETGYEIGGTILDGEYTPPIREPVPELPPVVVTSISRRQFFEIIAIKGWISWQEAEAAMEGAIPQALLNLLDELPLDDEQKFRARMLIKGATEFQRHHYLTYLLGYLFELDDPAMDDLFADAGAV